MLFVAIAIFLIMTFLYTRIDYLIHDRLYKYGLKWNKSWGYESWILYALLYQSLIAILYLFTRSVHFVIFAEAFCLSGTQDLIYFGLWNSMEFPKGDWTWMPYYYIFGHWKTQDHLALSFASIAAAIIIIVLDIILFCGGNGIRMA